MLVRFRYWERRLEFFGVKHETAKDHVCGGGDDGDDDAKSAKENPPMDPIVVVVVAVVLGVECYQDREDVDFPHLLFQGKLSPSLILL